MQQSLSSALFRVKGRAPPVRLDPRIARLEKAKLPGPLASIPKDMLYGDKAPTTMLADRLGYRGVNTGYKEDPVEYAPRVGGKLMHEGGVNTGEEGAWEGEDHWVDEQVPIGETFGKNFGVQPAPGHPEGFTINKYWSPVFGARRHGAAPGRPTQLAEIDGAEVEDHNGIPELRLEGASRHATQAREPAARSALSSRRPGGSVPRGRAQEREVEREDEERARTTPRQPAVAAQQRESVRDSEERRQARHAGKKGSTDAAAEQAAWLAAGSQGPVNAGGGVLNARSAAGSMEDGAVAGDEESDAMATLRAAMADSRQKTPGHREAVAPTPHMSDRYVGTRMLPVRSSVGAHGVACGGVRVGAHLMCGVQWRHRCTAVQIHCDTGVVAVCG